MTKPTVACAPSEDSDQPGHSPSLIRVVAVHSKCSKEPIEALFIRTTKTLIRLGGCPGRSESLLGARHFVGFVMRRLSLMIF